MSYDHWKTTEPDDAEWPHDEPAFCLTHGYEHMRCERAPSAVPYCEACDSAAHKQEQENQNMQGFHWREGWYFDRLPNGDVHLKKDANHSSEAFPFVDVTIPASEWASIVSSVSAAGETGDTYRAALAFHQGQLTAKSAL